MPDPDTTEDQNISHDVAMWGAAGCGKTTFLAALDIALTRVDGDWKVIGADSASTEVLTSLSRSLTTEHRFPLATLGVERYKWYLAGERRERTGRWPRRRTITRLDRIGLELIDAGGELFSSGQAVGRRLLDNLVRTRGIVYLFDPIREFEKGDAYDNLHGMLAQLSQELLNADEFVDGRLPHHLAVCVTKFDEVRVLKTADRMGLLQADPLDRHGFPRVMGDTDSRRLFEELCEVSASGNAELVLNKLTKYFHPGRIRYFVTSAIGFHLAPDTGRFDARDFQNLVPDSGSPAGHQIRSGVHPINVMEPMLWLAQRLSGRTED
jgi:hypothetical protein